MTIEAPEGMMSVEEFAKLKGMAPEKVINMIRDAFYVGRKIDDNWFIDKSEINGKNSKQKSNSHVSVSSTDNTGYQDVVVTDIKMPFGSMVVFMVKWVIASIPAFIILVILFSIITAILAGITGPRY